MKYWLMLFMLALPPAVAQQPQKFLPQLSTSDRIALQSLEKTKQDAQKQWQEAFQQEQTIISEFSASHPGYRLNSQTFAVEEDQKKSEQPKQALPTQK